MPDRARSNRGNNNFNLIRMVAASAVLISHAYPLALGAETPEPLQNTLGMTLGTLAIVTFFAISGYFISQSFDRATTVADFVSARVLRIYPALIVSILLCVFVLGPIFTTFELSEYFAAPKTYLYILNNLLLKWPQYELPGVFADNPYPAAVNGSLWTLFYEVACYGVAVVAGIAGTTSKPRRSAALLILYGLLYAATAVLDSRYPNLPHAAQLRTIQITTLPFVTGMAFYDFRQYLPFTPNVLGGVIVAACVSYGQPWFTPIFVIAWSYAVFYLGFRQWKPALVYNKLGDYSYGIYVYAFPVEQSVAFLYPGASPAALAGYAFPMTLALAVLSWHLVESHALGCRFAVSSWLSRSGRAEPDSTLSRDPSVAELAVGAALLRSLQASSDRDRPPPAK